ncbi:MAG: hypothetical protein DRQ88_07445 [Epsilonproteobacteria bacterium]|nr:MAG: hypothetical protein DRQ89_07880 [Campylobacterota bacterium]RLA66232.1 MAG: hypothetical protein DRQ88_07445 [Campylobacterota bacterium]
MPAESAQQALNILRDPTQFQWYVISLLAIIVFIYANEIEKRNLNNVFAGLAFWGMDWFNEIWNSLIFHFSGYAPVWGAPAKTSFLILIGLNIEILFMFAISGVALSKLLPKDKNLKIMGMNNRLFFAIVNSLIFVLVEMLLNHIGVLTWEWSWWSITNPILLFIIGYMPFHVVSFWVHDMERKNQIKAVSIIWGTITLELIVFGLLGWI